MINHFSKYWWIVVLLDKSETIVLRAIKACIATLGKPEFLQIENGSEFVNEELKMYLSKNRIHHIRGSPYHPQSQGAVEAFNRTVQNYLYLAKDMNEDEIILEGSILDFLLYFNNRVHTITRYSPFDIMEIRSDEKTMKKVRDNTLKSRKDQKVRELKKD